MRKLIILISVSCMAYTCASQVTMQPGIPALGLVQKDQLWNILVLNNSGSAYRARIDLVLRDRNSGLELMTAATGIFDLKAGATQLNAGSLIPIQYNNLGGGTNNRIAALLSPGNYTVCYAVSATGAKAVMLTEECVSFDVEPLSPPMLIFPIDSAVLNVAPLQFSWVPPTPQTMFTNLQYESIITEIREGQKANDAIEENLPFYTERNGMMAALIYPASAPSFEKEKWYAWQVIARDDRNYAGKSEVWVFKVSNEAKQEQDKTTEYILLEDAMKGIYQVEGRALHIKFYSFSSEAMVSVVFESEKGKEVAVAKRKLERGDNYLDFELGSVFRIGTTYSATISGSANKQQTIKFVIISKSSSR